MFSDHKISLSLHRVFDNTFQILSPRAYFMIRHAIAIALLSIPPIMSATSVTPDYLYPNLALNPKLDGIRAISTMLEALMFMYVAAYVIHFSRTIPSGPFYPLLIQTAGVFFALSIRRMIDIYEIPYGFIVPYTIVVWLPVYPLCYLAWTLFRNRRSIYSIGLAAARWTIEDGSLKNDV